MLSALDCRSALRRRSLGYRISARQVPDSEEAEEHQGSGVPSAAGSSSGGRPTGARIETYAGRRAPKAPGRVKLHMAIRDAFVTLKQEHLAQSPDKPYMTEREFWKHSQAKRVRRRPACHADQGSEVDELDEHEPGTADVTAIDKEGEEDEKDEEAGGRGCESEDVTGLCDAQASEGGGA